MEQVIQTISVVLGIAGLITFIFAILTGLRIIKVKSNFTFHKRLALIGFSAICIHAVVMLYFYFFT
jgi:hypothetical protein